MAKKYHKFIYESLKFCQSYGLLAKKDKIIISLSAGSDSSALTYFLHSVAKQFALCLVVVHFNHKTRLASDKDEAFAQKLSQKLRLPFYCFRPPVKFDKKKDFQINARLWRFKCLEKLKKDLSFDKIALGHHQDDLAETLLWKMIRGSSILNLASLKPKTKNVIRPLLNQDKAAILAFMQSLKLKWQEDKTNLNLRYTRNFLRNDILPRLAKISSPHQKLVNLAHDIYLLEDIFNQHVKDIKLDSNSLSTKHILNLPALFAKELISRFLTHHNQIDHNRLQIEKIYQLVLKRKTGKVMHFNRLKLFIDSLHIFIQPNNS